MAPTVFTIGHLHGSRKSGLSTGRKLIIIETIEELAI